MALSQSHNFVVLTFNFGVLGMANALQAMMETYKVPASEVNSLYRRPVKF